MLSTPRLVVAAAIAAALYASGCTIVGALPGQARADNVLQDGSKFLLESLGNIPGSRWLDGRTAVGTVGLAPRFGEPFSGTVWEPHGVGPRMFKLRNLGDLEGARWLTCRTDTGAVTLSATANVPPPATTVWRVDELDVGVIGLACGTATNAWLDGRTQTATVGLAPSTSPPFTGARWRLHEVRGADVLTNRNNNARTGASLSETVLTPALLKSGRFGKLFTRDVDGQVYAQPLYAENLLIGGGNHNTVFVATAQNSVYAFDADDDHAQSGPLWKSAQLGLPVPRSDVVGDTLIDPAIGIISTPVIDRASATIFVVAKSKRIDTITDQAQLANDDIVTIQTEGNIPGPSWLDAITGNGTVALAPQFGGDVFSGTWWQIARHDNAISFRSLGRDVGPTTPVWLDGRTADGTVGLAPNFAPPFTGASWRIVPFEGRGFTMQTLGTIPGPTFLDGRTVGGTVALIPSVDAAHSGAVWRIQRHSHHSVLYALDLLTGRIKASVEVGASNAAFVQKWQLNRPGLLLTNGSIYVGFGAHADQGPWHGWLFAFRATDLQPRGSFNTTPNGFGAGLWQSGTGLAADEAGLIYVMTGNSSRPGTPDLTNSFVQLRHDAAGGQFQVAGTFHVATGQSIDLNVCDLDLGSSGPVHVPGTRIILGGGKQGILYNIDTADMAHPRQAFAAAKNQYDASPPPCRIWADVTAWPHLHGAPALWPGLPDGSTRVYMWAERDRLKGFRLSNGTLATTPFAQSADIAPDMSMPGGVLSVSADGGLIGTGIVWATRPSDCPAGDHSDMDHRPCNAQFKIVPGILKAFDAGTLEELWSSSSSADSLGMLGKFNPPTIAHGRVYVGTFGRNCAGPACRGQLVVYGVRAGV
jgi:outer membrane protein assembly factor BamB